jgi:CsoR family transcriptional regulator, copper-sensing transcriptional repressor
MADIESDISPACHAGFPDHSGQLARLNRIAGQIEGVKRMIDDRRYCADILTQLRAIRSAVKSVEGNILEVFLGSCVADALQSGDAAARASKIAEVRELFKRYDTAE